jgi:hypothetical protein
MAEKLIEAAAPGSAQTSEGQQIGDVRWTLVEGQSHAFDHYVTKLRDKE